MSDGAEDKIVLKTQLVWTNTSGYGKCIPVEKLLAALGETYMQATNIGWETKALDALFEYVRHAVD